MPALTEVAGAGDCPELPESTEGFNWKYLPESFLAVLAPNDWHFLSEPGGGMQNYFISQENIGTEGSLKTGLTINIIHNDKKDALRIAKDLPSEIMKLANIEPVEVTERTAGNLTIYEFQYSKDFGEYRGTVYQFIATNEETNTVYVITFESPTDEWEEAWAKGQVMLNQLVFLDNQ